MKKLAVMLCLLGLCGCLWSCQDEKPGGEITPPEIEQPAQSVNFSFWDWQIGTAGDAENLFKKAKKLGFTGIDLTFRWTNLEYERGEYDFRYIDALLDEIVNQDMFLSTSLMFWSINLPWQGEIEWQKMENGTVYEFSGRGACPSFSDADTVKAMTDAYAAFTKHVYERYGERVLRMHARTSQYGELEYFCDADSMLDYGAPAVSAFRAYLKREHPTAADLKAAAGGARDFASADELDAIGGKELSTLFYFDWQVFRQEECLKLASALRGVQKVNAPGVPFGLQVGSIWDAAATTKRGVFDPWLASLACDILHTDDGPGYPHDFSMDYIDVNPAVELASEIDGRWHPAIQALVQKGDYSLAPYLTQAARMGAKGIKYLNTANWNSGDFEDFETALAGYAPTFLEAERRSARDETKAVLINIPDLLYKQRAATDLYQTIFNKLAEDGKKQVRFVTDSQLLAHPELLDGIETLYVGQLSGELCLRREIAALFVEKNVTLHADAGAAVTVKNEYRVPLAASLAPKVLLDA